ncbi:MAG: Holliday junction resolvase RuvX [bacterium]|nr:Holliday junction resolvase RuvX [bacterium]
MTELQNKTLIAVDYGRRRVGVAKSDATGLIASALTTLEVKSHKQALEELARIIGEHTPVGLVIGYPLLASGDRSDLCVEIDAFIGKLKAVYEGPIHRVDEYGSSEEAADIVHAHGKRVGRDKKRIDRLAAVVILQRFLDESG